MDDCNVTLQALDIASTRLDWYIKLSIGTLLVSLITIIVSVLYNRKSIQNSIDNHNEQLIAADERHKVLFEESQKQLKANHDWNRRSFTSSQISDIANELMSIRDELDILTLPKTVSNKDDKGNNIDGEQIIGIIKSNNDKFINFTDRIHNGEALTADEVHLWVCEMDTNGKHIPAKSGKNPPCKTSLNGEIIVNSMIKFINIYEQMGISLQNGIYDEKTFCDAFKHPVKSNYLFYKEYIEHRISEHGDENFGASFKWLYEYLWVKSAEEKRKEADK